MNKKIVIVSIFLLFSFNIVLGLDNTPDWRDYLPKNSYCKWNHKSSEYNMAMSKQIKSNFLKLDKKYEYFSLPIFVNKSNQAKIKMYYCDCDKDKIDMNCQIKFDRGLCEYIIKNKMDKLNYNNNSKTNQNSKNSSLYYINVSNDNNINVSFYVPASLVNHTYNKIKLSYVCGLDYMEICKKNEECLSNNCIKNHCQKRDYIFNKKMKIIKESEDNYSNFKEINFLVSSMEKFEIYLKYFDVIYDTLFIEKKGGFQIKFSPRENYSNYFIINLSENKSFYLDENERLKVFIKKYDYDGYKTNTTLIIEEIKQLKPVILESKDETIVSNSSILNNSSKTIKKMNFIQKIISKMFSFYKN